jgi:diguanylate cyclase (GGDEF)-like protein
MAENLRHPEEAKPIVLVIDDSPDVHRLLRTRLKTEDIELIDANNGLEGEALAEAKQPALVLLDLDLPGMYGLQVLKRLKDNVRTQDIPVIVLSGHNRPEDKVAAFELGAVDYITKPFELTELRVRIRSAIRMHQLVQMLAQRAQIDGLTGLWNRAFFDRRWLEEYSRAVRQGHPLSVAMLDIDHFKQVNDTLGHPAGDSVLQAIAKILQREGRASDLPCRYGGEEFVVLMPDTTAADAVTVCERIREAVQAAVWGRYPGLKVTISIGIAGSEPNGTPVGCEVPAEEWVESADRALYTAKRSGRNRTVSRLIQGPSPFLNNTL